MAIVSVETVLLVLLVVLVAALLRSHAEILRRLGPEGAAAPRMPDPPAGARPDASAPEIAGVTPTGDAIKLSLSGAPTLLAFLSSGCTSCARFWSTLGEHPLPDGLQPMIITRGPDREQRSKLRSMAPAAVPVVMSSEAWEDYAVPGSPYFVLVEGGEIRGEGVATTWDALASLVGDAIEEQRGVEERLAAAGIGPDHPSLYSEWSAAPDGGASPEVRV
ncbi:MAG TPA: hypothetical protein VJU80_11420 [Solirubrobacteraceae bacterium]|nr:hypothetical protein [Solirubrobacteraceae bacterium]